MAEEITTILKKTLKLENVGCTSIQCDATDCFMDFIVPHPFGFFIKNNINIVEKIESSLAEKYGSKFLGVSVLAPKDDDIVFAGTLMVYHLEIHLQIPDAIANNKMPQSSGSLANAVVSTFNSIAGVECFRLADCWQQYSGITMMIKLTCSPKFYKQHCEEQFCKKVLERFPEFLMHKWQVVTVSYTPSVNSNLFTYIFKITVDFDQMGATNMVLFAVPEDSNYSPTAVPSPQDIVEWAGVPAKYLIL